MKNKIKLFHVFSETIAYCVTNDDKVYVLGRNSLGKGGIVHTCDVNEPQIIQELCHKNIQEFVFGSRFVAALDSEHQVYIWGQNEFGQLGIGYISAENEYVKPKVNEYLINSKVLQLSCGKLHTLALTSDGILYGWGHNKYGQIGCGAEIGEEVSKPVKLNSFNGIIIKRIFCNRDKSFVITNDGLAYSWGRNDYLDLGHNLDRNQCVFEPKLINISNVVSIGSSQNSTYFLTNDGLIYFCG